MSETKQAEAEKAWSEHFKTRFEDIIQGTNGAIKGHFQKTAIEDYKKALRYEIAHRLKTAVQMNVFLHQDQILSAIDEVKPINP